MIVDIPDSIGKLLDSSLKSRGGFDAGKALQTLDDFPHLAVEENVMDLVVPQLKVGALGNRVIAARILIRLGDPRGVIHLTANSLNRHPYLGVDQTKSSTRSDGWLIRWAEYLTDECLDLLIADIIEHRDAFHADVLAAAPQELVVPRLLELLGHDRPIATQAAYALAYHGCMEGQKLLESLLTERDPRLFYLALVALSRVSDPRLIDLLRSIANQQHEIFYGIDRSWLKTALVTLAFQRLMVQDQSLNSPFLNVMQRFYTSNPIRSYSHREHLKYQGIILPQGYEPELFLLQGGQVTWTADFIHEFSTSDDRRKLANIQKERLLDLLGRIPEEKYFKVGGSYYSWFEHPSDTRNMTSYYLPEIKVRNELDDYIFAATDWIVNPSRYRLGNMREWRLLK